MSGLMLDSQFFRFRSVEELATQITLSNGPYVRVSDAWQLLGYPTLEAARKAAARDRMLMEVVALPTRREKFVRSLDLAAWLYNALNAENPGTIPASSTPRGNGQESP